jgi:PEP-CTERM motif
MSSCSSFPTSRVRFTHPFGELRSPPALRPFATVKPGGTGLRMAAAAAMALACLGGAQASTTVINFDPGTSWRTTTDRLLGQQWALGNFDSSEGIAVQTGYGNPATTSLPTDSMMWNCGTGGDLCRDGSGVITGGDGPLEAFFGFGFRIEEGAQVLAAVLSVIADDFFHLRVNGISVVAAMLDNHINGAGQPAPLVVDISSYLRTGDNVLSLRAMDGALKGTATDCEVGVEVTSVLGAFCKYDRGYEYVSVSGAAITVPEPSTLWLLGGSLGMLMLRSGARRGRAGLAHQPG